MKRILVLMLALSLGITPCVLAEDIVRTGYESGLTLLGDSDDPALKAVLDFIAENTQSAEQSLVAGDRYAPIRAYKLAWPDERGPVNQRVATEYVPYDAIFLVCYERTSYLSPFTAFTNVAIGVTADGSMERCATPDEIVAQTYDPQSFADFIITVYKLDGIERSAVTIYLPDENYDQLEAYRAEGVNSAVGLIEVLEKAKAVPTGTRVLSYDGKTLDLSQEFGDAMAHTGTAGEYLMMGAVVNTLLTNLNLEAITVTSVGKTIETGHAVYDEPLTFYESNKG